MIKLISPSNGDVLPVLTEYQKAFIAKRKVDGEKPIDYLGWQPDTMLHRTYPEPATLVFESDTYPVRVLLSEHENMSEPWINEATYGESRFYGLKVGKKYYWQVGDSEVRWFTTEPDAPRFIKADGVYNLRDFGGWKVAGGKRIKQGCIYRGCEIDWHYNPPKSSLDYLRDVLGFHTDLDLRYEAWMERPTTESPLGIDYRLIPIDEYNSTLLDNSRWRIRSIFEILANEKLYPIYVHCIGGADRTGTLFFILEGALGASEEDMNLDYELTSLKGNERWRNSGLFNLLRRELSTYGPYGGTYNEKCVALLRTCGVTDETLAKLRANLLED